MVPLAKVEEANERLRSVLASVSDCYFTLDRTYRITDLNTAAADWAGTRTDRLVGTCLWDLCDPNAGCSLVIRESMEGRSRMRREVISGMRPGHWLDLLVCPSPDGLSVFFTDVTERRAATAALDELAERLLSLQDEERQRIAEELHDSTAQHLVAVGLHLMRLKQFVVPEGQKVLDEAAHSAEEAAREVRALPICCIHRVWSTTALPEPCGTSRQGSHVGRVWRQASAWRRWPMVSLSISSARCFGSSRRR
jgi:PAS domain S-box-containing protein